MKRLGCLLLALAMLLTLAPALRTTANAAGVITGSRGSSEWSLDTDTGKLTISLTGTSPRWAEAVGYDYLNTLKEQVKSVVFVGNYTEIGYRSFRDFSNLSSVEIPDTVTAIGGHAFSGCALRSLTIPAGVTSIGTPGANDYNPFANCGSLTSLTVAPGNTKFKAVNNVLFTASGKSLYCCAGGKTGYYTTPAGTENVMPHAFEGCAGLLGVSIPDGITTIQSATFSGCSKLMSVSIPDSVTTIEMEAFENCGFMSFTVPASVTDFGGSWSVLSGCPNLENIYVEEGNKNYVSIDGVLFTADGKRIISYPAGRRGAYTVPDGTDSIGNNAFEDCAGLTGITIPESVKGIRPLAFLGCTGLVSVRIPSGINELGVRIFDGCTSLANVTLPEGIERIGFGAFQGCTALKKIEIPAATTVLDSYAFENCTALSDVTLNEGLLTISTEAFYGCTSLAVIKIPYGVTSIGTDAFKGCTSLVRVDMPSTVKTIGTYGAFSGVKSYCQFVFRGLRSEWDALKNHPTVKDANLTCTGYTVTYQGNNGTGAASTAVITLTDTNKHTLYSASYFSPPSSDKEFIAWEIDGKNYEPGEKKELSRDITVNAVWDTAVTGIALKPTELRLFPGGTAALAATLSPAGAAGRTVTWTSSDDEVAAVDEEGTVTAIRPGEATIIAAAGRKSTFCSVTVVAPSLLGGRVTAPEGALLIVAEYETDGRLASLRTVTAPAGGWDGVTIGSIAQGAGFTLPGTYKLMLVGGSTYAPLCSAWVKAS